ncbi:MAG: hypothetical protein ACE5KM_16430 [Planctomycetaceae bacterium]
MGDVNQYEFVRRMAGDLEGPFLEIGSHDYGSTQDLRPLFSSAEQDPGHYVGADLLPGDGVDVAIDLTRPFADVNAALNGRRFGTIFCLSVLEHCAQPFAMADNMTQLLTPGGKVVISAPFAWKFHGYPSDYWRFTQEGIRKLFPGIQFDDGDCFAVTSQAGDFRSADADLGRISLSGGHYRKRGEWLRAVGVAAIRACGRLGLFRWLTGYRYVMPPTNVMMVGTARECSASKAA